ncbi:ammonium transporter [Catellatospora sp. TT07R-123]|uniref:ammonium transporter n=1 Tax=Catellatospora sp. TT07R-123 TaxID=2733863 RepID=UPI001B0C087F|nr:ammonium transporter [Catellatospora sp. TT07R-123]GHJ49822.1 ammonium transporter [Catellatospora sp. TT07R-123]
MLLAEEVLTVDTGNTTWLLVSSALVLLMTPGLAFFYGGLNRSKSVLNMMMMSFASIGLISVLWLLYGFSLSFGINESNNDYIGSFTQYLGFAKGTTGTTFSEFWFAGGASTGIPTYVFMVFQMMFAIITVALISGSLSDRTKFFGWLLFATGWFTLVYVPVAHWVWGGGFIGAKIHALDFAGGTAVHINAGAAALAAALVVGKRVGWPKDTFKPHNVPFVALGAGLLWFGWFGFNAGSELTADGTAAIAFVNTQVATAAALLGWLLVEWIRDGKPTLVGASSGAVAGLVAITPACGFISPWAAVVLGLVAGAVCALAVSLKYKLGYDDSLDVVGVHFVGGWIGSLAIGLFANAAVNSWITDPKILGASEGLFYGGGVTQLGRQALASGIVSVYSFTVAGIIAFLVSKVAGLRVSKEAEIEGIDISEHAESAYDFSPASGGGGTGAFALAGISTPKAPVAEVEESAPVTEKVSG